MVTSIPAQNNRPLKSPSWVLWIGLLGIVNFLAGCLFLFPPNEGVTVYFWFAEFYTYLLLPSLLFFPISIMMVVFWLTRFIDRSWLKGGVLFAGVIIAYLCFMPALGTAAFASTLRVIGRVNQNGHFYYLVEHYEDEAPIYSFCESDAVGFSGTCRYIGWKGDDHDPKIYIDRNTNLITVESENPSFTWINSVPPTCINDMDESNEYVGGCSP